MSFAFTNVQLEILKMLEFLREDKDLTEIKSLLAFYLSEKVVRSADKVFDEKKYISDIFEKWEKEHFRISA